MVNPLPGSLQSSQPRVLNVRVGRYTVVILGDVLRSANDNPYGMCRKTARHPHFDGLSVA